MCAAREPSSPSHHCYVPWGDRHSFLQHSQGCSEVLTLLQAVPATPITQVKQLSVLVSQVCREYQRGNCNRGENDCRFAHPADSAMIDTNDNTVTVCMDYIKGRCSREKCKYFHPPAHLQAKIKAAQYQVNQAAAAQAAATAAAMVSLENTSGIEVC